jgi:GntR family histidine utilization transcriptional repressor
MQLPHSAGPLYERVKSYILGEIGRGRWGSEQRLPSESELVEELGISRMTIHRAMRELMGAGILRRIPGVGTFVAAAKSQSALVEVRDIAQEIAARGGHHKAEVKVLEAIRANADLVKAFEFSGPAKVFHSIIVHSEDRLPIQLEERFVNPAIAPAYLRQDFSAKTTFEYLQQQTPVTEVEHVISAIHADDAIADALRMRAGDPCLLMRRRTWSGALVATVNRFIYPGERYALGSRYKPGRQS